MRLAPVHHVRPSRRQAFSLIELLVASSIGLVLGGMALFMFVQAVTEQRKGLVNATVEQKAYQLQANICAVLRSASANQGMTPDYSTPVLDGNGNLLGYSAIFVFNLTNGGYTGSYIQLQGTNGLVTYTPNMNSPSTRYVWMTNRPTIALKRLCFSTGYNLDLSRNSSLVNVRIELDDHGYAKASPTNNPATVYRSFSVQMRND